MKQWIEENKGIVNVWIGLEVGLKVDISALKLFIIHIEKNGGILEHTRTRVR